MDNANIPSAYFDKDGALIVDVVRIMSTPAFQAQVEALGRVETARTTLEDIRRTAAAKARSSAEL